jgi:hypothetical protein
MITADLHNYLQQPLYEMS